MANDTQRPSASGAVTLAALVALGLLGTVSAVTVFVQSATEREVARKGGAVSTRAYRDLADAQRAELEEEAQWVDRRAGVLSIPIERAMELVVEELARDPENATPRAPGEAASARRAPDRGAGATAPSALPPARPFAREPATTSLPPAPPAPRPSRP